MPLVHDNIDHYPQEALCPCCKKNKVLEPHSFAHIGGGALLYDRKEDSGQPHDDMGGFLYFGWHGAHHEEGGEGKYPDINVNVRIANEVVGGQYGIFFCSTECLRFFLNTCVDKLEQKMKQDQKNV